MKKFVLALAMLLVSLAFTSSAQDDKPLLLRQPTLSRTDIAFMYGDDLWKVSREGGDAVRLTAGPGIKRGPHFSPDGQWIAFTGEYDGKLNVYVISANGGTPRRVTFHAGPDVAVGWTPDGKNILFASPRDSFANNTQALFTVPAEGGFPTKIPLPLGWEGSYSADGKYLAYRPTPMPFGNWSHYRGGTSPRIWIADLADSSVVKLPHEDWNDLDPMWVADSIYFLSDRNGPYTLFAYDTKTKAESQLVENTGFPIKSANAGPGAIVYEQFGSLHLFDLSSHHDQIVTVHIAADLVQVRPHFEKVAKQINNAAISPTGVRAVFEAHGEILTVPAEKGDIRDITNSPGVADRDPSWSPDGKWIAYFSDESGEYALHLRAQNGMGDVRKIGLGDPPSFFYGPTWSPDSKKIAYTDKRLNLWYVDLDKGTPVKIDTDYYQSRGLNPDWSADNRWIVYTKILPNHFRAVFVYSLDSNKSTQITDGMSDAEYASLRQKRQVHLLHRQHQYRPHGRRSRYVQRRQGSDAQRLRHRSAQGFALAASTGKRRGENRQRARKTRTIRKTHPRTTATRTRRKTQTRTKTKARTRKRAKKPSRSRLISTISASAFWLFRFRRRTTWPFLPARQASSSFSRCRLLPIPKVRPTWCSRNSISPNAKPNNSLRASRTPRFRSTVKNISTSRAKSGSSQPPLNRPSPAKAN